MKYLIMNKKEIKNEKEFDCVKMMREIRNKIDAKISKMTRQEERIFLNKIITKEIKL